jgi:hypothetical protein
MDGGGAPRLAVCANVFPGDRAAQVADALAGPWAAFVDAVGAGPRPDFGLYLGREGAEAVAAAGPAREAVEAARARVDARIWTANAFPIGGFHGDRVKREAFRPSWDRPERLAYTLAAATSLCALATAPTAAPLSLSTCPLGHGADPLDEEAAVAYLRSFATWCRELEAREGILLRLALEPEPDGRFEEVGVLANWLATHFDAAERRHLGVCWDICHGEVVGESPTELLARCRRLEVVIAKVQVSAALTVADASDPRARERLAALARDPYLHQVRGRGADGRALAFPDLQPALDAPVEAAQWTVHCHVPVHAGPLGDGLAASPWRDALLAARAAGIRDFELETYTLPILPEEMRPEGLVGTMAAEWAAVSAALDLTSS